MPAHARMRAGPATRANPSPMWLRSAEEDARFLVAVVRHCVELAEGLFEGNRHDVGALEGNHVTPVLLERALETSLPLVLDADALNLVGSNPKLRHSIAARFS